MEMMVMIEGVRIVERKNLMEEKLIKIEIEMKMGIVEGKLEKERREKKMIG